ncbi:MAG: GIY-YIG nuclease family protein [Candidatus Lokiarchaeota archaeon]|nr:GIY-YIG nuclease family protein [Candidatus Lokiarchaeota archaeon]
MFYVYILECTDFRGRVTYYTGQTNDLMGRFRQHATHRGAKYTHTKGVVLLYAETFKTRSEAVQREAEIKAWNQEKKRDLIDFVGNGTRFER